MTQDASFTWQHAFPLKRQQEQIYTPLQQIVYDEQDTCDLSVYRLKLNDVWHVVVLGEKPSDVLYQRIEALLTNGTLVTLRPDALQYLQARRAQATLLAPWVEAHYDTPEE
jgi:hypothetical protein